MLVQLVYISTMRQPVSAQECAAILAKSRVNNAAAGITGLLVVGGNRFLQLLEGEEEAVMARLAKIRTDPRHYAIVLLDKRLAETRQCPEWAMGYMQGAERADGETLSEIVENLVAPIDDPYLRAQFSGFAAIQDRAA